MQCTNVVAPIKREPCTCIRRDHTDVPLLKSRRSGASCPRAPPSDGVFVSGSHTPLSGEWTARKQTCCLSVSAFLCFPRVTVPEGTLIWSFCVDLFGYSFLRILESVSRRLPTTTSNLRGGRPECSSARGPRRTGASSLSKLTSVALFVCLLHPWVTSLALLGLGLAQPAVLG